MSTTTQNHKQVPKQALEILQDLIACKSVTPYNDGACEYIGDILHACGFSVRYFPINENGVQTKHIEGDTTQNLFATYYFNDAKQGPHLLFAGHTDVVPAGDNWRFDPFSAHIEAGCIYGRGTSDMKGAIAAFIDAILRTQQQAQNANTPFIGAISLLITGDEEGAATYGTKAVLPLLSDMGITFDACITGEPTNPEKMGEMIKIGRRGSCNFNLTITGKQGHVGYPHLAHNSAHEISRMLHLLANYKLDDANEYFDASQLAITHINVPNDVRNVIPATAYAHFNIRFNDHFSGAALNKKIYDFIEANISANFSFDLEHRISGESFYRPPDHLLQHLQQAIHAVTQQQVTLSTTGGTSDSRFIQQYCPVLDFGMVGKTMHQVDEHIMIEDLITLTHIYEKVISSFLQKEAA